jgi:hypothetical protein
VSLAPQNLHQAWIGLPDDEGNSRLGDAGLLAGDLLETIAKILHMVPLDLGNAADQRMQDVGAVEPSSQTYLDHGHFDAPSREVSEGKRGRSLEEGGLPLQDRGQQPAGPHRDRILRNRYPIHLDALAEGDQMG